ncbi:hypothetical protein [Bartonella sp. AP88XZML]|uniref:hypothetical protein n=1 Tax=Bartonella sp. AP88XZML TaxID=3243506 RepID=UPI0035CF77EF
MCNGAGLLLHKRKDDVRCRAVVVGGGAAIIIHGRCCEVVLGALEMFFKKAREWQSKYIPFGTFCFR